MSHAGALEGLKVRVLRASGWSLLGQFGSQAIRFGGSLITAPNRFSVIGRFLVIAVPVIGVLLVSPAGDKIIDLIPFVGTVDDFNVTYRQRLVEVSMNVVYMHPFFGSFDYLLAPAMQELVQGEGIIDMVNSYLGIALAYGFVGLALFSGVFITAAWGAWMTFRRAEPYSEVQLLGRSLLATLAGVLVIIATVSSVLVIPHLYWIIAACASAMQRSGRHILISFPRRKTMRVSPLTERVIRPPEGTQQ